MVKKKYTLDEVIVFIKAFHLDTQEGRYSKELLEWCNQWIENNVKNPIGNERQYHLVPESRTSCEFMLAYEQERVERIPFVYLHGDLQRKAESFDGWDIFGFLDEKPESEGVYHGFIEYPDGKIACTIFMWKWASGREEFHGLVVADDDKEFYEHAKKCFKEKTCHI